MNPTLQNQNSEIGSGDRRTNAFWSDTEERNRSTEVFQKNDREDTKIMGAL